jgi:hypothetical protein
MHLQGKKRALVADNGAVEMKAPMLGQQTGYAPQTQSQPYNQPHELAPQHQQPYDSYGYSQAQMGPQQPAAQQEARQHYQQGQVPQQYQQGQTPMSPEDYNYLSQQQQAQTYTPPTHPEPYHSPPQ